MEFTWLPWRAYRIYIQERVPRLFPAHGPVLYTFVSPRAQGGMKGGLSSREINDILPEHNRGFA